MAVAVAVQALAQERNGTQFIDHGGDADLDEFGVIPIAVGDVSRGDVAPVGRRPRGVLPGVAGRTHRLRRSEVGRVKVQAVEREFGEVDGLGGDGGLDGVALGEEGVEGSAQAVIVEAVGGDVPEEVRPGVVRPTRGC